MPWTTPRECLVTFPVAKLSQLTLEKNERPLCAIADGATAAFTSPYFMGTAPTFYVDGVLAATSSVLPTGTGERWKGTLSATPTVGKYVTCASGDGINVDTLNHALYGGQEDILVFLVERYIVPTEDAVGVHRMLKGWSLTIAAFKLASDPRRAGLLDAYPEIAVRYAILTGMGPGMAGLPAGTRGILQQIASGKGASLRGILSPYVPPADDIRVDATWNSEPAIFDPPSSWGRPTGDPSPTRDTD